MCTHPELTGSLIVAHSRGRQIYFTENAFGRKPNFSKHYFYNVLVLMKPAISVTLCHKLSTCVDQSGGGEDVIT